MIAITPNPDLCLLPPGTVALNYAEDQPQYLTLPVLRTPDGRVVTMWQLEPNDRLLLANGVPITLVLHTFGQPLQPIMLVVGGVDLRDSEATEAAAEPNSIGESLTTVRAAIPDRSSPSCPCDLDQFPDPRSV